MNVWTYRPVAEGRSGRRRRKRRVKKQLFIAPPQAIILMREIEYTG